MFELSVALKYLIPRRRQLSVSIIALLSVLVIALVVWLVVVFLSVTHGIERRWIETLTSLNAPLRLTPTQEYFNSYYYKIDSLSSASDFTNLSIGEKLGWSGDPYDPQFDTALPPKFPQPHRDDKGQVKDLVGATFASIQEVKGTTPREFDVTVANLRLRLLRPAEESPFHASNYSQSYLNQVCYLAAFDADNPYVAKTFAPPSAEDAANTLDMLSLSNENAREEAPGRDRLLPQAAFAGQLQQFFSDVQIASLKTAQAGWVIPPQVFPKEGKLQAYAVMRGGQIDHLLLEEIPGSIPGTASFAGGKLLFEGEAVPHHCALVAGPDMKLNAELEASSVQAARDAGDLRFNVQFSLSGLDFDGIVPYRHLTLADAKSEGVTTLAQDEILLATSFRENDVRVGDRGYIAYYAGSAGSLKEQRLPVRVAGFYDPGLMPAGNKLIFVSPDVTADIRSQMSHLDNTTGNGIAVWFDDVYQAGDIKAQILTNLEREGLTPYWKVETYEEYEFAKPLLQQFQSDRTLFSAIALIIIAVACSNIISMLILLVNDKRKEIGILRAMGAKGRSITSIFAVCGTAMGFLGSVVGIGAALLTLRHLDRIISVLSAIQGHTAFNEAFYGGALPNSLSLGALLFVAGATVAVSVVAGIIPALKATRMHPSTILRSE